MGLEEKSQCAYWPLCSIHRAEARLLTDVQSAERQKIVAKLLRLEGVADVAKEHHLTDAQVRRILQQSRNSKRKSW